MYVSGGVDIFDMVDINLFTIVALNMMVLKLGYTGESEPMFYNYLRPLTSLDVGLYALACEEDVRCLDTLVRSFKLIKCIPDCILTPPTDESVITYTQLSGTHRVDTEHGTHGVDTQNHVLPTIQSHFSDINLSFVSQQATASQVIDDVIRQLSFDETKLDGGAGFADVAGSGMDSSKLSHDESFRVDDLDSNELVNINVSQVETQSELPVSEEPVVEVSTKAPIVEEVKTLEFSVEDVVFEDYVSSGEDVEHGNGHEDELAPADGQFFYNDEGIDIAYETEYDVHFSEDAGTYDDDDDDVDEDFLVDEENEIVEPDVESRVYLHFIESRRNLKLYKNDSVMIRARCEGKVHVFTMSQGTGPTGPYSGMEAEPSRSSGPTTRSKKRKNTCTKDDIRVNPDIPVKAVQELQRKLEVQISMSKAFRAKAKAEREIIGDHVLQYSMLRDYVVELLFTNPNTTIKIAVERNTDLSLPTRCLGDDIDLHPNLNFTFISDRQKRAASATNVRDFEKCMLELKTMNPKAHEWLNKILAEHWAISHFSEPNLIYCSTTSVRIMESIKKEAHLMKVQWNRANKYQVSEIPCKHVVAACWNMALNDRAAPPLETWVGRSKKKRKRSKHEDEPFVKDGGNNAEGSGSASRQAQQTEPAVGQDVSGGSGVGAVISLFAAVGEGDAGDPGVAGVASQGECMSVIQVYLSGKHQSSHLWQLSISDNGKFPMVDEEEVTPNKLAPTAEEMIMLIEVLKRNCISPSDSHP
uniref:Transposase, MuDR, MULE transposase domain protein n=1 Tax=Tanacetum cinerariifolium TaxID=118510 RepID=A0A699IEU9_TANCI|nr:hypothetical protein [Tanacetum cinerariifolium]